MVSLVTLIIILALSALITKVAAVALTHTGLSKDSAKFQARSAFTGVGFTTDEAESVVRHPARRKIIMTLMLIGNVGVISALASLMLTFVGARLDTVDNVVRFLVIVTTLAGLWALSKSKWLENRLVSLINKALGKYSNIQIKDYVALLNLGGEYEITVVTVKEGQWMENKRIKELELRKEGINLIGIHRANGNYVGAPHGDTRIVKDDQLTLYGRKKTLLALEKRRQDARGEAEHQKAQKEQEEVRNAQNQKDKESRE